MHGRIDAIDFFAKISKAGGRLRLGHWGQSDTETRRDVIGGGTGEGNRRDITRRVPNWGWVFPLAKLVWRSRRFSASLVPPFLSRKHCVCTIR